MEDVQSKNEDDDNAFEKPNDKRSYTRLHLWNLTWVTSLEDVQLTQNRVERRGLITGPVESNVAY